MSDYGDGGNGSGVVDGDVLVRDVGDVNVVFTLTCLPGASVCACVHRCH